VRRATARSTAPPPASWDERVEPFVSFVEKQRGLAFDHPVEVTFLDDDEFDERVTTRPDALTDEDREELRDTVALLRALGLVEGDLDLLEVVNRASTEGILAFYDFRRDVVNIRGTRLDLATEVTIVHELVHALQDQHFDLERVRERDNDDESGAIRALIEGDATVVEEAYVESLSEREQREYREQSRAQVDAADFEGVPSVVQALFSAPYTFGPALVQVLYDDGGQDAVDDAFEDPPTAEEHVFDPTTYVRDDEPETVDEPPIPDGAEEIDRGEFEPLAWFLVLSEHLDPHDALRATDGWGGDAYVSYRTDRDRVCVRTRYRGEHPDDTDEMTIALVGWMAETPALGASVEDAGDTLQFESCDPGTDANVATGASLDALALPVARVQILQSMLEAGVALDASACVANGVVDDLTVAELSDPSGEAFTSDEGRQRILAIATRCRAART
jgi:hypothetical protein